VTRREANVRAVVALGFIIIVFAGLAAWAVWTLAVRLLRFRCGVCLGWNIQLRRARRCPYCGYDKRLTPEALRNRDMPVPPARRD
jgi:hypothetical protein